MSSITNKSVLELSNLTFRYAKGKVNILENFNCSFRKGEITSIVGSSGKGKTTLLMLISAMEDKYNGTILFNDTDMRKLNKDHYRSRNIGVIFQNYNLLFHATPIDNVRMGLYLSGGDNSTENAIAALSSVGITGDKIKRRCLQLSGGEQQRVAIARALTGDPDVILADEPTGNLDETNGQQIFTLFKTLAKENGKCVILATHSTRLADLSDRVIAL
jgi:putative ABC transport system ATP-binding protein